MFKWFQRRRRRRIVNAPFPLDWEAHLERGFRHLSVLTDAERRRLRDDLRIFTAEKHWEGCNGLVVTDEMRVTIAAHAVQMGLGFPQLPFDRLLSVLIYPDTFISRQERRLPSGVIDDSDEPRLGEAWYQGPVVLSWRDVREQCLESPQGRNVVVHEFAHLLDMQNGSIDGVPVLEGVAESRRWVDVFHDEYRRLQRQIRLGRNRVLDDYGGTSEAEFFAVASESFFEQPAALQADAPALYDILRSYYGRDPAT